MLIVILIVVIAIVTKRTSIIRMITRPHHTTRLPQSNITDFVVGFKM